jgi:hypothetical protein
VGKDIALRDVAVGFSSQLAWPLSVEGLPEAIRAKEITLGLKDRAAPAAVGALARLAGAEVHLRPGEIVLLPKGVEPEWTEEERPFVRLERAIRIVRAGGPLRPPVTKIVPVRFRDVTLEAACREVGHRLRIEVVFDPRIPRATRATRLTLENDAMTGEAVLTDITAAARLSWAAEERRILVTDHRRADLIREERQAARTLAATEVSVAFSNRPLWFVAKEIGRQIGVPVIVDRRLWEPEHPRITHRQGPVTLSRLLHALNGKIPARSLTRGEAVYLVRPGPR